ncbi:hypothetical protein [Halopelagius longus]|uniref:DUF7992 domain-containing protein n=1 Tax=Halopelagius longus TaxID=1236180 RepID=A0A1H1ALL2_9EURY|nr:hypothetical protein [Halopelagius longus]RDI70428.1 hypothetical protein DWB78_01115 [Halopelagius longus]SDQ40542.1 hypothetical protein SAMN05216278_1393 [Halopelagius longus]
MTLDVETPTPPMLKSAVDPNEYDDTTVSADDDYRRDQLSTLLREGAWEDAFEEWAADASMTEEEWDIVTDLDLVSRFDFFWDDFADRVGYHAPGIPEDWKEREVHPELSSWKEVSSINAGLTEFGQLVCEVLKEEYITWESEYEAPDDLPDF